MTSNLWPTIVDGQWSIKTDGRYKQFYDKVEALKPKQDLTGLFVDRL